MATAAEISKARHLLGELHREFAKRFNVARTTIYQWEKVGPPQAGLAGAYVDLILKEIAATINGRNSE